jgi:osmoprotectant transport system permease protein
VAFLRSVWEYLSDPASWTGGLGILTRLSEHLQMSALTLAVALAIALPLGLAVGPSRRHKRLVVSIANVGRALPSLAILALLVPFSIRLGLGIGFWPTVVALVALAIPPIVTNTYVGIQGVDADTVEAARGVGMTGWTVLRRVEVPLATPLIVAGVRIAALQVIATATLAALVGWGGLGRIIVDGFAVQDYPRVFAGALLVATLAVGVDLLLAALARAVAPRTRSDRIRPPGSRGWAPHE